VGLRQLKFSWSTVHEAIKLTLTILVYSWAKQLPEEQDNQLIGSLIDLGVALASAIATLVVLNATFGLPKIQIEWVVNGQTPRSDRPELTGLRHGIFFRYSIVAKSGLSKLILSFLRKHEIEACLSFSPDSNLQLVGQYLGGASHVHGQTIMTKFGRDLVPGDSVDGDFSLRLRQMRTVDTPVDCNVTLRPSGNSERNRAAKLGCRLVKSETVIKGFLMKGGLLNGSTDRRDDFDQARTG
jgi:hypothetical protein